MQFPVKINKILLTGTPIQNDLTELYSLMSLVNEGIFGTKLEF
jgi:SNF2 family DNA or RNA helicase